MDEQNIEKESLFVQEQKEGYTPRPTWQVWAARIGVIILVVAFLLYCYQIATAGGQ